MELLREFINHKSLEIISEDESQITFSGKLRILVEGIWRLFRIGNVVGTFKKAGKDLCYLEIEFRTHKILVFIILSISALGLISDIIRNGEFIKLTSIPVFFSVWSWLIYWGCIEMERNHLRNLFQEKLFILESASS